MKRILKALGFEFKTQRGSHEHWTRTVDGRLYKVTVDCPKQPFADRLLDWMIDQAGVSKREFYDALG